MPAASLRDARSTSAGMLARSDSPQLRRAQCSVNCQKRLSTAESQHIMQADNSRAASPVSQPSTESLLTLHCCLLFDHLTCPINCSCTCVSFHGSKLAESRVQEQSPASPLPSLAPTSISIPLPPSYLSPLHDHNPRHGIPQSALLLLTSLIAQCFLGCIGQVEGRCRVAHDAEAEEESCTRVQRVVASVLVSVLCWAAEMEGCWMLEVCVVCENGYGDGLGLGLTARGTCWIVRLRPSLCARYQFERLRRMGSFCAGLLED